MILSLLPKPPRRIDTATLERQLRERGLDIHRRTIQRDLIQLAAVFPLEADERNKPFGWRWGAEVPPIFAGEESALRMRLRVLIAEARTMGGPLEDFVDRLEVEIVR